MPNINTSIHDSVVTHQIYLERFSSQVAREMIRILRASESGAKEIFDARLSRILELGFDSGPATSQRTAKLISELGAAIEALRIQESFDTFDSSLNDQLEEFAGYESGFIVRSSNDILDTALAGTGFAISMEGVAATQVWAAATAKPFTISPGTMANRLGDYMAGMSAAERRRIEDAVTTGVVNGDTTQNIVRSVWGTVKERDTSMGSAAVIKTRRGAEGLVRTAIKHVSAVAQEQVYGQNSDLIKSLVWTSTLDSRVSAICASRDGNVYPINEGPRPPAHFNAICAGEMITTATGKKPIEQVAVGDLVLTHRGRFKPVTAVMSKPCDTNVIRVITMETGRAIRVTDEHPVLLDNSGWVRADEIKIGHKLFENVGENKPVFSGLSIVVGAPNDYPSIFDGDEVFFKVGIVPGEMASSINLDNDPTRMKNKIPYGPIHNDLSFVSKKLYIVEEINKILLPLRNFGQLLITNGLKSLFEKFISFGWISSLHSFGMVGEMLRGFFGKSVGPMGFTNTNSLGNSFLSDYSQYFGFTKSFNPIFTSPSTHSAVSKPEFSFNGSKALLSDDVMLHNEVFTKGFVSKFNHWVCSSVSDISIVAYEGDVYNLEVKDDHTYLVNDMVVHNCRSVMTPRLKTYRELGINVDEPVESTRAYFAIPEKMNVTQYRAKLRKEGLTRAQQDKIISSLSGQTDDPDFGSFLARQSKEFQETVLGKQRTELYRKGELSLKDLISPKGKYYTLDELRRLQPDAFDKAGIE